ncbi:alkaline phosphatase family protein [candidate division KSB1 bacterium]|nr:alkaline phosphatase family protein [candidate division KSB1 bacterium]
MAILFIFIDGIGIGLRNHHNPCGSPDLRLFNNYLDESRNTPLPANGSITYLDANLNTDGLPQSATGQTSIFTGQNAAAYLGYHKSGFPNERLRDLLERESLFVKLKEAGHSPVFINAYRSTFFELGPEKLLRYLSVTSIQNWKAGCTFFSMDDLLNEQSIYHDFTNQELIQKGYNVPVFTPERAAAIASRFLDSHQFVLYEYFKTDRAGHRQHAKEAATLLRELEEFLLSLLEAIDLGRHTVILTSDHGNIEDLSIKTHTRNPVPFMVWGNQQRYLIDSISSLVDIRDKIFNYDFENV